MDWSFISSEKGLLQEAFFLKGAQGAGANLNFNFLAVYSQGFYLQIRLPGAFGMAHRKTDIAAVLFAFFVKIKSLHNQSPILQIQTDKINLRYT
jgi:hypothetical protein